MERAVGGVEGIKHHAAGDLGVFNFLKGMAAMMSPNPMPLPTSGGIRWPCVAIRLLRYIPHIPAERTCVRCGSRVIARVILHSRALLQGAVLGHLGRNRGWVTGWHSTSAWTLGNGLGPRWLPNSRSQEIPPRKPVSAAVLG